jgi:hypothetical protein
MSTPAPAHLTIHGDFGDYDIVGDPLPYPGRSTLYAIEGDELLYKRYPTVLAGARERVDRLVRTGREVTESADPNHAAHGVNWPHDYQARGSDVDGIILKRAPARFMEVDPDLIGGEQPRRAAVLGMRRPDSPPAEIRLRVLLHLARSLSLLRSVGLTHGDLTANNVLCSLEPPGALVIDCDSLHYDREPGLPAFYTPGWSDPRLHEEKIAAHDIDSDAYAYSLMVWRLALRRLYAHPWRNDGSLDIDMFPERVRALFEQTFPEPLETAWRPAPKRWANELNAAFFPGGRPNHAALEALDEAPAARRFERMPHERAKGGHSPQPADRDGTPPHGPREKVEAPRNGGPAPANEPRRPVHPHRRATNGAVPQRVATGALIAILIALAISVATDVHGGSASSELLGHVPRGLTCKAASAPSGAQAELLCSGLPDGGRVRYLQFVDDQAMNTYFNQHARSLARRTHLTRARPGGCRHPGHKAPYLGTAPAFAGRVLCISLKHKARFAWTSRGSGIYASLVARGEWRHAYRAWRLAGPTTHRTRTVKQR